MKNSKKITAGRITGEIGFLLLCIIVHIEMVLCMSFNPFANLILLFIVALLTVIIYIRSIVLGYLIEEYLINHKILKNDEKDNII